MEDNIDIKVRKPDTIGGSEISIVMGLNRWKTPLRLWAEKTGKFVTEDIGDREYIQMGNELEDFVAKRFTKLTGIKVRRDTKTFTHKTYPNMIAHIDRRVVGTDELLECKTCNAWKAHEWEGEEIPREYILQVMWYLGVLEMSKGYIAVLIGGNHFVHKEITFDQQLFDKMLESARHFVDFNIKQDEPPVALSGDSDTLLRMYPDSRENIIVKESRDEDELIGDIQFIKSQIIEFKADQEAKEALLKQKIGEAEGMDTPGFKVFWKNQAKSTLDYDRLKADGLYEKYVIRGNTRVLRINRKKEDSNGNAK